MKRTKTEQELLSELQLRGKGGADPVERFARSVGRPKAKRGYRNRLNSKTNRPATVDPVNSVAARMAEITAGKGARNNNYGQPHSESEEDLASQLSEFLEALKGGTLNEQSLTRIQPEVLLQVLRSLRSRCMGGWSESDGMLVNEDGYVADPTKWNVCDGYLRHISGQQIDFYLVCDAISVLERVSLVTEDKVAEVSDSDEIELFNRLVLGKLGLK